MDSPPFPEPVLEEIFLRLPTQADLARAAASFRAFRRLVTEQSFLRLYRKLHAPPPPLVGFLLRNRKFLPVDPSYSAASAAGAVVGAADFSFKFLPADPSCYVVSDIRDGRVLLNMQPFDNRSLLVCDPLHRRFALLPPIPSSYDWVEPPRLKTMGGPPPTIQVQTFLAPTEEEAGEDTSFRVFWMASKQKKQNQLQLAFVFSSVTEMYSVENTGASGNTSGSGQLVWTNSMSTMMLNYLVVLVAVGARTSDQFTRVHHNYCGKALSGHFKVAITGKQVCNHIKKWREIWGKVEKVKYSSGALWDAGTCNIRRSEKHSAGHSKARKDVPLLNTSVEQRRAMERIFGTSMAMREYAKSGSETLSVKVRGIEEDAGNGEVNLLPNVGEPSNSKPPQKKKAKVVNTENDA